MNNKQTIYMDKGTPKMISKAKQKQNSSIQSISELMNNFRARQANI